MLKDKFDYRWLWVSVGKNNFVIPIESGDAASSKLFALEEAIRLYKNKNYNGETYSINGAEDSCIVVVLKSVNAFGVYPKGTVPYPEEIYKK